MEVPKTFKVTRGSYLNDAVKEIEAVDPQKQQIVALNDYLFKTDALVVDIVGGDKVGQTGREVVKSPSMILIMGPDGELDFRQEIENIAELQSNVIPPDPREEEQERMNRNQNEDEDDGGRRKRGRNRRGRKRDRDRERDPE